MTEEDDLYYPTIEYKAFCKLIENTNKCEKVEFEEYKVVMYVIKGVTRNSTINIRTNGFGDVHYELATSTAIRLKFVGELNAWFKEHKNWHDGAYI